MLLWFVPWLRTETRAASLALLGGVAYLTYFPPAVFPWYLCLPSLLAFIALSGAAGQAFILIRRLSVPTGRGLVYGAGIRCLVAERNPTTTAHPKMDITNARTMEMFRRAGLAAALREVAVPEDHCFDVSWITRFTGEELHRFRYARPAYSRALVRLRNDGTCPVETAMRVSQVEIEPVLR